MVGEVGEVGETVQLCTRQKLFKLLQVELRRCPVQPWGFIV